MNNIKKQKCLKPLITQDLEHFSAGSNLLLFDPHEMVFLWIITAKHNLILLTVISRDLPRKTSVPP